VGKSRPVSPMTNTHMFIPKMLYVMAPWMPGCERSMNRAVDHERIYSPNAAIEAATRLMPGIATELIPGAHHIAAVAKPELVNSRILEFLSTDDPV
jgi:hypothetical protein